MCATGQNYTNYITAKSYLVIKNQKAQILTLLDQLKNKCKNEINVLFLYVFFQSVLNERCRL